MKLLNETIIPEIVEKYEELAQNEKNLERKINLIENKKYFEKVLIDFWKKKIEKVE